MGKIYIARDKLKKFIESTTNRNDWELHAMTTEKGIKFYEYLLKQKNNKGELIGKDHANRLFSTISKALDFGIKKSYLAENLLLKVDLKCPKERIKVRTLSESEVMKIYTCDGITSTERKVIDGFVLICYTGFRNSDDLRFLKEPKKYIFCDETDFRYIELSSFKNRKDEEQESSLVIFF